jgi:pentatricopeptide repeat protein
VRLGLVREALFVFGEIVQQGPRPGSVSMLSVFSACAHLGDILFGKQCHGYILRNGLEGWYNICNAMIDMYMKCGKQEMAHRVFDCMSKKTVVSRNLLIAGLIRNGNVESAWEIFEDMPDGDLVSWNTMVTALVQESMFV